MHDDMMHDDHGAFVAHEEKDVREGLVVNLNIASMSLMTGTSTRLDFFVNRKPDNIPVPITSLQIEHEKYMHVIGVRSDMNGFFHIHPGNEYAETYGGGNPSLWRTEYIFPKPGLYKIWSEVKKDGVVHSFGHEPLNVEGEGVREDKKVSFGRSVVAGGYQVALLADASFGKGVEHDLSFDIHDSEGNEVAVEEYLGADMHLAIIKDDWSEFVHTHPEGHDGHMMEDMHGHSFRFVQTADAHDGEPEVDVGTDEAINFHVRFPSAGLYRAYAQFRPMGSNLPRDEALTAMFWIEVKDKAPFPISPWWMLLIISLIAIVVLSRFVKKYIGKEK